MKTDLRDIEYEQPLSILIGENGSGKSQALADIAEAYISKGYRVIAIANCPFDKFRDTGKRYHFMGGRYGQSFIGIALRSVIESIKEPSASRYHVGKVLSYLGYESILGICKEELQSQIDWHDLSASYTDENSKRIASGGSWTLNQNKDKLYNWPAVFLRKDGVVIPLEKASSGEIQLLTALAFIASNISDRTAILIDEPENSLHPRWQRNYIDHLLDLFQSSEPKVFIATHAPILVTAAPNCGVPTNLYRLQKNGLHQVSTGQENMEQVLWEAFRILTPRSTFLSRHMADLLHKVQINEITRSDFNREFDDLHVAAQHDEKQQELIIRARMLVNG